MHRLNQTKLDRFRSLSGHPTRKWIRPVL